jgi:lipase chaperone LimK
MLACLILGVTISAALVLNVAPKIEPTPSISSQQLTKMQPAAGPNEPEDTITASVTSLKVEGNTDTSTELKLSLELSLRLRRQLDDVILTLQTNQASLRADLLWQLGQTLKLSSSGYMALDDIFKRYQYYSLELGSLKAFGESNLNNTEVTAQEINFEYLDITSAHDWLKRIQTLQQEYFSQQEISAFFKEDNKYNNQALARLAIRQDSSLNPQQKRQLIAHQISQLEDSERRILQPSLDAHLIMETLSKQTPTQDVLTATSQWSEAVHHRVNQTKSSNQAWLDKVQQYQDLVANLTQQTLTTNAASAQSADQYIGVENTRDASAQVLNDYLNQHFNDNEQKRLKVFLTHPELFSSAEPLH